MGNGFEASTTGCDTAVYYFSAKSKEAEKSAISNIGQGPRTCKRQPGNSNFESSFKVTKTGIKMQICPGAGEARILPKTI